MGAQLRVYRRRIRSVQSTKKITRAMELIAASRIVKAQQRVTAAQAVRPADHPGHLGAGVAVDDRPPAAAGADRRDARGGARHHQRPRPGRRLQRQRAQDGRRSSRSCCAARARRRSPTSSAARRVGYYRFRGRDVEQCWTGFSEQPSYEDAREVADALIDAFLRTEEEGGVGEIHVVHTEYVSALTQRAGRQPRPAAGRRGVRRAAAGGRAAAVRVRARPRTRCSTRCCRATSRPASTRRCSSRRRRSRRRAGAP